MTCYHCNEKSTNYRESRLLCKKCYENELLQEFVITNLPYILLIRFIKKMKKRITNREWKNPLKTNHKTQRRNKQ